MEKAAAESKKWDLEPESEYRFELDPGTSLAIKVCAFACPRRMFSSCFAHSSLLKGMPRYLDSN